MSTPRVRLKYACVSRGRYGLNYPATGYVNQGIRLIRTTDLAGGVLLPEELGIYVPEGAVDDESRLMPGDLLLSRSGTIGRAFLAPPATEGMAFAGFLVRFRPKPDTLGKYIYYCTQSNEFQAAVNADAVSSTIQNFNAEKYENLAIPLPELDEQRAIADFLDRETRKIDDLINEQRALIKMLAERRDAVVSQLLASCGGNLMKLSWLFSFHNGDRGKSYPSREEFVASGIPFINAGHLDGGEVDVSKTNYITTEKFSSMGGAKLTKGDILFCLRGSLGKIGLFESNGTGALASSLVAIRANIEDLDPRFFVYVLGGGQIRRKIEDVQTGSAQPNLSVEQLRAFRVNVPDYRTQIDTRSKIDDQTSDIDKLISESEDLIALSQERRSALITAAVNGQIDVRATA